MALNKDKMEERLQLFLERKKVAGKKWRDKNPDKVKEYNKNYYEKNKIELAEKGKKYRAEREDKDKRKAYRKKWGELQKQKANEPQWDEASIKLMKNIQSGNYSWDKCEEKLKKKHSGVCGEPTISVKLKPNETIFDAMAEGFNHHDLIYTWG